MNYATEQPTRLPPEPPDQQPWWLDGDPRPSLAELPPQAAPVSTVVVHAAPHLRSFTPDNPPIRGGPSPSLEYDYSIVLVPRAMISKAILALVIGTVPYVLGQIHLVVPTIVAAAATMLIRDAASRVTFTFADGFLAFRQAVEWPRGVQEEYDVTWAWPTATR